MCHVKHTFQDQCLKKAYVLYNYSIVYDERINSVLATIKRNAEKCLNCHSRTDSRIIDINNLCIYWISALQRIHGDSNRVPEPMYDYPEEGSR